LGASVDVSVGVSLGASVDVSMGVSLGASVDVSMGTAGWDLSSESSPSPIRSLIMIAVIKARITIINLMVSFFFILFSYSCSKVLADK
jgi:tetrahydrodipicolinate N-succinyltransferase